MTHYELWNTHTGNITGTWPTEIEALRYFAEYSSAHLTLDLAHWALLVEDDDGESELVADGDDLLERAMMTQEAKGPMFGKDTVVHTLVGGEWQKWPTRQAQNSEPPTVETVQKAW